MLGGHVEHGLVVLGAVGRLDQHGAVDPGGAEQWGQIVEAYGPVQLGEVRSKPRVIHLGRVPEVLMSIHNPHDMLLSQRHLWAPGSSNLPPGS